MESTLKFPGQQEDERILFVIEPHKICLFTLIFKVVLCFAILAAAIWFAPSLKIPVTFQNQIRSILALALISVLYIWFKFSSATTSFLTDRRLMRFDSRPPFSKRRRGLFWTEVAKAKAFSPNMLYRLMRVGSIELRAKVNSDENVIVENVYYFDDLVNYIDKLLHLTHANPVELKDVRPFVLKPKGKRD